MTYRGALEITEELYAAEAGGDTELVDTLTTELEATTGMDKDTFLTGMQRLFEPAPDREDVVEHEERDWAMGSDEADRPQS